MKKIENLKKNKDKQYYIPMEVNEETIRNFGVKAEDVQWSIIGNKLVRVIMVAATEEQYYEYMRPLWREDKRSQRHESMASLDKLYDETEYDIADTYDLEADIVKRLMIYELHKALDELEEIDRTIVDMYSNEYSEAEIGQAVGMSQRGVGKRKQRIFMKLRSRLQGI